MIKYEDLMANPKEMAFKLYNFINASNQIDYAYNYLESHYTDPVVMQAASLSKAALGLSLKKRKLRLETQWRRGELSRVELDKALQNASYVPLEDEKRDEQREKRLREYYATVRLKDFKHDHWKHEMEPEILQSILEEPKCKTVLKLLYP